MACVVGAGSLVGRAVVDAFGRAGATVVAVDPEPFPADVSVVASLDDEAGAAVAAAVCDERFGRLDVLFTCQGMLDHEPPGEAGLDHWERVLRTNLLGPIAYTRAMFPLLARSDHGAVVYLGSIDGTFGNPAYPAYSVSKGGIVPLTHVMADAGAPLGIRVNAIAQAAISPVGTTDPTPLPPSASRNAALLRATPLRRRVHAEELGAVAVFLASDDAAYVTGAVLPVDGGRTAVTPGTGSA